MHGLNHVHRRGAIYVWRRRLPKSLGENRYLQVSLRTNNFFSANRLAALVNEKFVAFLPWVKNERISIAEAQRFLSAEVASALRQIEEDRFLEPDATSPDQWRTRYFNERCRSVALRIVASRRSGACLLDEDRQELMNEGFTEGHLLQVCREIEILVRELDTEDFELKTRAVASAVFLRDDLSAHDLRAAKSLRLQAQAIALEETDRRKTTGPFLALNEEACVSGWMTQQATTSAVPAPVPDVVADAEVPIANAFDVGKSEDAPREAQKEERKDDIAGLVKEHLNALDKQVRSEAERNKIAKDVRQRRSVLRHFLQAISSRNLLDLTQTDLAKYDEIMDTIPIEHGKSPEDRQRTVHELVERGEDLPEEEVGLSWRTKNRNWGIVKSFLKFARVKHGIVPVATLFFEDLYAKVDEGEANVRLAFTKEDVEGLSQHPVWRNGHCPERDQDGCRFERFGLYWMPIIADLTGMRREEIAGMRLEDVVTDHAIPHFDVRPNQNRRLKNKSSKRVVPIHMALVKLGFFEYVEGLRSKGEKDLFPDLKPAPGGSFGGVFYKAWKRVLDEQLGPDLVGKVFHSFRHRFITLLRTEASIPKDIVQDIVGHKHPDETDGTYFDKVQFRDQMLIRLNPAVQSVPSAHWLGPDVSL
ncbi:site-specific integrase [Tropicibacter alexandrii]|uniref:site-specific integrase n=1 Tax=Tropicibacter alexandrii TaxID=2267683 RepID=UPI0013E8E14E|nr:site-specific integrase [Tropicibacter alexandrii]